MPVLCVLCLASAGRFLTHKLAHQAAGEHPPSSGMSNKNNLFNFVMLDHGCETVPISLLAAWFIDSRLLRAFQLSSSGPCSLSSYKNNAFNLFIALHSGGMLPLNMCSFRRKVSKVSPSTEP